MGPFAPHNARVKSQGNSLERDFHFRIRRMNLQSLAMETRSFKSQCLNVQKSLMSVIFPPVILGPGMAAPILWAPGIFVVLSAGKPPRPKNPRFRGSWFFGRGGCQFYFYGRGDFSDFRGVPEMAAISGLRWRFAIVIAKIGRFRCAQLLSFRRQFSEKSSCP